MNDKPIIMVVEDEDMMSLYYVDVLKNYYEVRPVPSGESMFKVLHANRVNPDLIILDIHLTGIDGWEILSRLQKDVIYKKIPVIVVSGLSEDHRAYALNLGAKDYISKPLDHNRLLERIKVLLGG